MNIFAHKDIKSFQSVNGLTVTGVEDGESKLRVALLTELEDEVRLLLAETIKDDLRYDDLHRSRPMAAAVQTALHVAGYDIGDSGVDGWFGNDSIKALDKYCQDNVINGRSAAVNDIASKIFKMYGGSKWFRKNEPEQKPLEECMAQEGLSVEHINRANRARVVVSNGEISKEFTQFKKGYYTNGTIKMSDLDRLDFDVPKSVWDCIEAVSKLEGNMDAINTWDNSFMSLGMFQWTLGTTDDDGELGDLLELLKASYPSTYDEYFGQFGMEVEDGEITIEGEDMRKSNKCAIRTPWWCFRFWHAAQDEDVQSIMIELAVKRLRKIQNIEIPNLGRTVGDLFTDAESLAQCLQIHVNRPAYLDDILNLAIREANTKVSSAERFLTQSEGFRKSVLREVREVSKTYGKTPVTDAYHRFDRVAEYFRNKEEAAKV